MLTLFLVIIVCFILLTKGADIFVAAASKIARKLGWTPIFIGATVMAFGTSAPELFVSVQAALFGSSGIALGNVIGSNIANIGLCLGVASLLTPIVFTNKVLGKKIMILLGLYLVFYYFAYDFLLTRIEGWILLILLYFFIVYMLGHKEMVEEEKSLQKISESTLYLSGLFLFGLLIILVSSNLLVKNAIILARLFKISEVVIGMSIVAFGTSLPELVTSVVAVLKKEHDISIGNIIGSNIFNIAMIIGVVAVIGDTIVAKRILLNYLPVMFAFGVALLPALYFKKINRIYGLLLFAGYLGYLVWLF